MSQQRFNFLTNIYKPEDLAKALPFKKAMVLSKMLLENEKWDSDLQEYAIELIENIKQLYSREWNRDWKHEAYLGYAYGALGWDIEKEFEAYSTAVQKSATPPIEILMHMALLWSYPGIYKAKMDEERAIRIFEKVVQTIPYIEAVGALIRLYEETKQIDKAMYWKEVLKESEQKDLYDKRAYLDFFNEYRKESFI